MRTGPSAFPVFRDVGGTQTQATSGAAAALGWGVACLGAAILGWLGLLQLFALPPAGSLDSAARTSPVAAESGPKEQWMPHAPQVFAGLSSRLPHGVAPSVISGDRAGFGPRARWDRSQSAADLEALNPGGEMDIRALRQRFHTSRSIDAADVAFAFEGIAEIITAREGRLSSDEAAALSGWLRSLAEGGSAGMEALRDFLSQGLDAPMTKASGAPSSLRVAALEALAGISTLEAVNIALEVLAGTHQPLEVAAVARMLEEHAPGQYTEWVAGTARELLDAGAGSEGDGVGMGPLMDILGKTGGVTPGELDRLPSHQREYSAVTLSLLPEGAGVPLLLDRMQGPDAGLGNQDGRLAAQLLAQMAAEHPRAATELVALARSGLIPDALWPDIASLAAGTERIQLDEPRGGTTLGRNYFYKAGGTQLLYRARTNPTVNPAEAQARLGVVGRLLDAAAGVPAAQRALAPLATRLTAAARQGEG